MTERPDNPRIHGWLDQTVGQAPDPVEGTRQVMSQVEETSQVGRWLPFSLSRRKARTSTSTPSTTDYQPSPIPASNGHTPTAIGRTPSMFSPVKAITAGAIVFAIGGAFLIAQPFGQETTQFPAAETAEAVERVEFTGRWSFGNSLVAESFETVDGDLQRSGGVWRHSSFDITDPRFDGDVAIFANRVTYDGVAREDHISAASDVTVFNETWRVENDDGAWQGEPVVALDFPGPSGGVPRTTVFHGEGAYEGLIAVVEVAPIQNGWDLRGVIVDGDLPPDPEPRTVEER